MKNYLFILTRKGRLCWEGIHAIVSLQFLEGHINWYISLILKDSSIPLSLCLAILPLVLAYLAQTFKQGCNLISMDVFADNPPFGKTRTWTKYMARDYGFYSFHD